MSVLERGKTYYCETLTTTSQEWAVFQRSVCWPRNGDIYVATYYVSAGPPHQKTYGATTKQMLPKCWCDPRRCGCPPGDQDNDGAATPEIMLRPVSKGSDVQRLQTCCSGAVLNVMKMSSDPRIGVPSAFNVIKMSSDPRSLFQQPWTWWRRPATPDACSSSPKRSWMMMRRFQKVFYPGNPKYVLWTDPQRRLSGIPR